MADVGPLATLVQPAPQALQAPQQPVQPPIAPDQLVSTQQIQHILKLNWLHFKQEFACKLEEDA